MPSLVLAYLLSYVAATGQFIILLSSELCSIVGVPGGDFQALVDILGQAGITWFTRWPTTARPNGRVHTILG